MWIKLIWSIKIPPQDDLNGLHELGLSWYRFEEKIENFEKKLQNAALPAVWIKFNRIEQMERLQSVYPEAKLGPATSFNEALIFADSLEHGEEIRKKVTSLFEMGKEVDEMEAVFREDSMEDY